MAKSGDVINNPVTKDTITFRKTAADTGGALLEFEDVLERGGIGPPEHLHPRQQERFTVTSGTVGIRIAGHERLLRAGDIAIAEPGQPHAWWNAGDDDVRMVAEFRPALATEHFFETLYGLARDGKLDRHGMPAFLQIAAMVPPGEMYLAKPPLPLQKLLFAILGPIANLRGYRFVYPRYSPDLVATEREPAHRTA